MKWTYHDGGRAAAGFKGKAGDCGARAVAIAAELPYQDAYDRLNAAAAAERRRTRKASDARTGVWPETVSAVLLPLGFEWVPTMRIGSGCRVHLVDGELPGGRLVVRLSRHYAAVIDGIIYDTHDPSERAATVYPVGSRDVPPGARRLDNGGGWIYEPARCVYGYWRKVRP